MTKWHPWEGVRWERSNFSMHLASTLPVPIAQVQLGFVAAAAVWAENGCFKLRLFLTAQSGKRKKKNAILSIAQSKQQWKMIKNESFHQCRRTSRQKHWNTVKKRCYILFPMYEVFFWSLSLCKFSMTKPLYSTHSALRVQWQDYVVRRNNNCKHRKIYSLISTLTVCRA